jgi:hypothetical protein
MSSEANKSMEKQEAEAWIEPKAKSGSVFAARRAAPAFRSAPCGQMILNVRDIFLDFG